ncbi:phosphate ABC transporter permease PstA [Polymorphospora rubra]|uniref:Phosphate transport system permease protein PstA n=1 Tax=Polymorphospora rubra TaxID=338584 RepID=A0A810N496_9ACTN|nr:phosphate ABC transporter permease PstA [Polymorphospora rubra]BCJ68302.1 phosphate transport system permease protein PstA [Polymorphospora rubra]
MQTETTTPPRIVAPPASNGGPARGTTSVRAEPPPAATEPAPAVEPRRELRPRTLDDVLALVGSVLGGLSLAWLLFRRLLPTDGAVGFVLLWLGCFLLLYAAVTMIRHPAPVIADRIAAAVVHAGAALVGAALLTVIGYTVWRGLDALVQPNFYTQDLSAAGPLTPLDTGGALHAIVGTLIEISIAIAVTLPLGVATAVFITEVGGRFSRLVRTIVEAMTALPSIVAGLFIYTVLQVTLGFPRSGLAAALALSVMMLPIIARAADVVLRVVPGGLREASLALGASQWQTVWHVVLPTARPGLATALILGTARGVGETSPVLLTSGASNFLNADPLNNSMNSLPLFVYSLVRSGEPTYIARAFGGAALLLVLVLVLFVVARVVAARRDGTR